MNMLEAINSRKSIRGYKPDPVPREILEEIVDIATRAPSAMNTQPWEITIATGEILDSIRQGNVEMLTAGVELHPDVPLEVFEGEYRQRQVGLAIQLFQLMDIAREDKEKRAWWQQRGFRFFDAPAAIILSVDKSVGDLMSQFDCGAFSQTLCLVALKYGLGTCIEDQGVMFPDVVRRFARIPDSKRIAASIAIGYPDWDFPANRVETKREPVENVVTWLGFD